MTALHKFTRINFNLLRLLSGPKKSNDQNTIYTDTDLAEASAFFDPAFYLRTYPDVSAAGVNPLHHYLQHGWKEFRRPNAATPIETIISVTDLTEAKCPVKRYREVFAGNIPLETAQETTDTTPDRDADTPTDRVATLLEILKGHGLNHAFGHAAKRQNLEKYLVPLFSPEWYRRENQLPAGLSTGTLFARYLLADLETGTPPSPLFSASYYANGFPRAVPISQQMHAAPIVHWLTYGVEARESPNPYFDADRYLSLNPDLAGYPHWLFEHFINHGINEGRQLLPSAHICNSPIFRVDNRYRSGIDFALHHYPIRDDSESPFSLSDSFANSTQFNSFFKAANALEPLIGGPRNYRFQATAPIHDTAFFEFKAIVELIPRDYDFDCAVFVPFCKLGGADYVSGLLVRSLMRLGRKPIVIRTDQSSWERPDWFPSGAPSIDLSRHLSVLPGTTQTRILYECIRLLEVKDVFNVNSLLMFKTLSRFGKQLSHFTNLHCYYFCADRDTDGFEAGYPISYFSNILPWLATAITDTQTLNNSLRARFSLTPALANKVVTLYTPTSTPRKSSPKVALNRDVKRLKVYWGGRLDRQKRFDLVLAVARRMPDVQFLCWGKAVLDTHYELPALPPNVQVFPPFATLDDIELELASAWLYTSEWDGLPTILLECGIRGVPIVASAVGGVPELINAQTGWLVEAWDRPDAYVSALKQAIAGGSVAGRRSAALRQLIADRHSFEAYSNALNRMLQESTQ